MQGTMIWFNPEKRHGFIRTDEGGLGPGLVLQDGCRGTRVGFERIGEELDDARAVNVTVLPLMPERRARSRGRR